MRQCRGEMVMIPLVGRDGLAMRGWPVHVGDQGRFPKRGGRLVPIRRRNLLDGHQPILLQSMHLCVLASYAIDLKQCSQVINHRRIGSNSVDVFCFLFQELHPLPNGRLAVRPPRTVEAMIPVLVLAQNAFRAIDSTEISGRCP